MDPKDLMITNQFISPQTSNPFVSPRGESKANKQKASREFTELKDFLRSAFVTDDLLKNEQDDFESDEENDYDILEPEIRQPRLTSVLHRPQWIHSEEPLALSQGVLPILSKSLSDTTRVRYRKQIVSYINIDSRRRDIVKYPNPGNYRIFLNKEFHNLYSIRLENIIFREPPTPINSSNNCFVWTTNYTGLAGVADDTTSKYQAIIPGAFYTLGEFVQVVETTLNAAPHNLTGGPNGLFPMFRLSIDPFTRAIRFIQRLEEFIVTTISTTAGSNVATIRVRNQSGTPPLSNADFPFVLTEAIPIILTGLEFFGTNFGGIPVTLIDQVPFYPNAINTNNWTVGAFPGSYDAVRDEYIYMLEVFNQNGSTVNANQSIVTLDNLINTNLPNFPAGHAVEVTVGRALTFSISECSTFGRYLGLQDTFSDILIHTNFNTQTEQVENKIPWMIIGAGQLTLDTTDYILMRIETRAKPIGTISNNLTCAIGSVVNAEVEDHKKNDTFFAKILFAGSQPGDVIIRAVAGDRLFYDAPLVQLIDLDVSFFDASGNLLILNQNHNFVLQIVELQEVLRDTLIDSRTGNIADIGAGLVTTNPLD